MSEEWEKISKNERKRKKSFLVQLLRKFVNKKKEKPFQMRGMVLSNAWIGTKIRDSNIYGKSIEFIDKILKALEEESKKQEEYKVLLDRIKAGESPKDLVTQLRNCIEIFKKGREEYEEMIKWGQSEEATKNFELIGHPHELQVLLHDLVRLKKSSKRIEKDLEEMTQEKSAKKFVWDIFSEEEDERIEMSQDPILCVSYFDPRIGPSKLYCSEPLTDVVGAPDLYRILEFNYKEGTFTFAHGKYQTVNHLFYIDSKVAGGVKDLLMITFMIKPTFFKFYKDEIAEVFKCFESKMPILEDFAEDLKRLNGFTSFLHLSYTRSRVNFGSRSEAMISFADEELKASFLEIFNRYLKKLTDKVLPLIKFENPLVLVIAEPDFLNLLKMDYEVKGYKVITSTDPKEALKIIEERYNEISMVVILLDITPRDLGIYIYSSGAFKTEQEFDIENSTGAFKTEQEFDFIPLNEDIFNMMPLRGEYPLVDEIKGNAKYKHIYIRAVCKYSKETIDLDSRYRDRSRYSRYTDWSRYRV